MNRLHSPLIALMILAPLTAWAQCWDSSQQTVSDCKVTATGSTTLRALKDRFSDVVNVKDFGAAGNGVTNDQPAISAAIAAAAGTVFFPPGIYVIYTPLRIAKSAVLVGSGSGSVIKAVDCNGQWPHTGNDDYPLISIRPNGASFSDVTVTRLTLDGSCANRSYGGWEFNPGVEVAAFGVWSAQNVWLRELHIKDVAGDGITVRGDPTTHSHGTVPSEIFIEDNFIERWHQDRQGVAVIAGNRVNVTNNHLVLGIPSSGICPAPMSSTTDPTNGSFGIDVETNATDTGEFIAQVQISGNVIHHCNGGINIANQNYPNNAISGLVVHDNTIAAYSGLPQKPLQVNGTGISGYVEYNNRSDDGFRIYQNAFRFWPDGTLYSSKGAFLSSTGVWTNASSREYKEDIRPLEDPLTLLRQIEVYRYRYRADHGDDGRTHVGVIAEELPEEVASVDGKGAPTGELIALSLAANRALLKQVEAQEVQLNALGQEVQRLRERRHRHQRDPDRGDKKSANQSAE
jgi:hypothetical protein